MDRRTPEQREKDWLIDEEFFEYGYDDWEREEGEKWEKESVSGD